MPKSKANKVDILVKTLVKELADNTDYPVKIELDKDEELNSAQYFDVFLSMREKGYKVWTTFHQNSWMVNHLEITLIKKDKDV